MPTKIEWTEETWNPITGCTPISEGCQNCYAARMAKRLAGRFGYPKDDPFKPGVFHQDKLLEPMKWKKPRKIFVCSMGDLFHPDVNFQRIRAVWQSASIYPKHTYIFLTKRPARLLKFTKWLKGCGAEWLKNMWLGVTAENQQRADERIPILLQIPAAVRFVSVEPMLGPVDLTWLKGKPFEDSVGGKHHHALNAIGNNIATGEYHKLDWVICGGETGPGARYMHPDWARNLRDQCITAGVPFFFKQRGSIFKDNSRLLDGREWNEYPEEREG